MQSRRDSSLFADLSSKPGIIRFLSSSGLNPVTQWDPAVDGSYSHGHVQQKSDFTVSGTRGTKETGRRRVGDAVDNLY